MNICAALKVESDNVATTDDYPTGRESPTLPSSSKKFKHKRIQGQLCSNRPYTQLTQGFVKYNTQHYQEWRDDFVASVLRKKFDGRAFGKLDRFAFYINSIVSIRFEFECNVPKASVRLDDHIAVMALLLFGCAYLNKNRLGEFDNNGMVQCVALQV